MRLYGKACNTTPLSVEDVYNWRFEKSSAHCNSDSIKRVMLKEFVKKSVDRSEILD